MRSVLIDSSIWIEYFRGSGKVDKEFLDELIDNNIACTNDLILSELVPFLKAKEQNDLADLLFHLKKTPLEIDWNRIIEYQTGNIRHGINSVGIPDLIIVDNVINNSLELLTLDRHFTLIQKHLKFKLL